MPRLVAVRHGDPTTQLRALDEVWAAGDAALPLDAAAPASGPLHDALLARLRPAELRDDTGVRPLDDPAPVATGTALVVATSGSTGAPRGIVLSHDALAASTRASRERLGAAEGVPWLGVLPLHHVAGISVVLRSRAAGREPLLHARAEAGVLAAAEPSWVSLVPTQLRALLGAGADLARHHGVLLGGAAADAGLLAAAADAGVHLVTSYGATETCGGCVYDGVPLDGTQVRTTPAGTVELRSAAMADGERLADGTTASLIDADGWWTTSDRGRLVDGRLEVLGRVDDVVVSGGENVPLAPVRAALATLDGIDASDVVGLPHQRWGTAVAAVVVPDGPPPTLEHVREALATLVPRRHLPTMLVVGAALPTTGLGKVTPATVTTALREGTMEVEQ